MISLNGKNYTALPLLLGESAEAGSPVSAPKKRVRNAPSPSVGVLRSQSLAQ